MQYLQHAHFSQPFRAHTWINKRKEEGKKGAGADRKDWEKEKK